MGVEERRQREFLRREHELLDAALSLFDENDWDRVTVAAIADKAEVGKGTFYKHFASKDEIYARLALDFVRALWARLEELDVSRSPEVVLRELIQRSLEHHLDNPRLVRVARYCERAAVRERLGPETRTAFERLDARFYELGGELLERGIESGVFGHKPLAHHKLSLSVTFHGAVAMAWKTECAWPHFDLDRDTFIETITDFMLAGLSASDATS